MYRNRILEYGVRPAASFTANPHNPRRHPPQQRQALREALTKIGFIAPVIENQDGYLIDGHERIWQALQQGDDTPVPYVRVALDEEEARFALATFDPLHTLAMYDKDALSALLASVQAETDSAIGQMLDSLRATYASALVGRGEGEASYVKSYIASAPPETREWSSLMWGEDILLRLPYALYTRVVAYLDAAPDDRADAMTRLLEAGLAVVEEDAHA